MSLKAQWERSSSRGQYSPSRSSHKTADIKKEFAAFGQSTSISNRNRVRYSKEDILALYKDNLEKPVDVKGVPKLIVGDCLKPVVLKPMGYEELNGIWDFHLSKRQGRRGGNNTRFQRNTGNQRGNNDARRARSDGSLSGQNDRWGGRNDSNRSNNNTDRSGGRWGRLDGSDGNNRNNNNNNATFGGNEWRRGQKPQVSNRNRNDMNNEDTFGDGMLGVGGADNNTFEDFAANSAKFEQEMANLRKNAGMGLKMSVDSQGDKFGGALEKDSSSTTIRANNNDLNSNSSLNNPSPSLQPLSQPLDAHALELQMQRQQAQKGGQTKRQQRQQEMMRRRQGKKAKTVRNATKTTTIATAARRSQTSTSILVSTAATKNATRSAFTTTTISTAAAATTAATTTTATTTAIRRRLVLSRSTRSCSGPF